MDDPQIRYARTEDGVNIAYWTMGSGPPLVEMNLPYSNVQFELQSDLIRTQYEARARVATVIRYDHRGFGLSDKPELEFTTGEFVRDLEAVVDKLDVEKFLLFATGGMTYPVALEYAKLHPERVLRIVATVGDLGDGFMSGILDAAGSDWQFASEAISRRSLGWGEGEAPVAGEYAALLRASMDEPGCRRLLRWLSASWAVRGLRDVHVPCLVLALATFGEKKLSCERTPNRGANAKRFPARRYGEECGGTRPGHQIRRDVVLYAGSTRPPTAAS